MMVTTPPLPKDHLQSDPFFYRLSPLWQLAILGALIFIGEMVAMVVIYFVETENYAAKTLLDGIIMTVLISPGLYWLQFRPLLRQMSERKKADVALRESEKLLRNILEILPVGVWITDAKGNISHGNQASLELWSGARYVGIDQYSEYKGWWLDSGKRIEPEEWAAARAISQGETSLNEEIEIECFDGVHKIIYNSAKPIFNEEQEIVGTVVVNQDITALKRAQQELEEREALFRTAMDNLPVGVWLTDGTGKIIYGNPAGQEIWAGARYVGIDQFGDYKGWWLETGKRIEPEEWAVARAINKGETSLNEEIEIECFDGTHKIILNSAIPVCDEHRRTLWAFVVNQDITARKQRERELIHTNELLERFFSSIDTSIAYMDRDFNFIRVNETYANSAGHSQEYFLGKNHFDLYPHEENEAIFKRVVETGEPFSVMAKPFEYVEYPERGVTYWDWSLQPVKRWDGVVEGVVLSLVDVTERKRAEYQLAHQNQELRLLSDAEHRQRELAESLVRSTIALNASLEHERVLASILEQIRRTVPFRGADIILVEGNTLRVASYSGFEGYPESQLALGKTYSLEEFPLLNMVCSELQPVVIEDTQLRPDWRVALGMEWVRSYAAVPLVADGKVIGIINLTSETPGFFNQETAVRVNAFAPSAAVALRNAQLYKAELYARQTAETLSTAAMALAQTLDMDQVLHTLMEYLDNMIASDISGVGLLEGDDRLAVRLANGYPRWKGPDHIFPIPLEHEPETLLKKLISTRKSQLVEDTLTEPLVVSDPTVDHVRTWLLVPIIAHDKAIGIVGLGKIEPGYFTRTRIRWVEALVSQAAVAIQNAWLFGQVRATSERLQSLARKLVDIQEKERFYIARELHDEAGQALSSLKIGLGRLEQNPDCPEMMRRRLQDLKQMADGVLEDLHRLAMDLRPVSLDQLGLVAALEQHAHSLSSETLTVEFKTFGFDGDRVSPTIEVALYRIVQEALTNVVRHAHATTVGILLERRPGKVLLFIEDDGIGFDTSRYMGGSMGLVGMQERAELLGGTLTVESLPGKGTSIRVEVPDAS